MYSVEVVCGISDVVFKRFDSENYGGGGVYRQVKSSEVAVGVFGVRVGGEWKDMFVCEGLGHGVEWEIR
jgi:hypothetical protein